MKYFFLSLLFFSIIVSAQKTEVSDSITGKVQFKFNKITEPSTGVGMVGMQTKKAFAVFIDEKPEINSPLIFNEIKFETVNFNKKKSSIFLCIYENMDGLPGNIIGDAKIYIEIPIKKTEIIANLSQLNISVPAEGYFIGFEWILTKENEIKGMTKTENPPYNPTIAGFSSPHINLFVYHRKWEKADDQLVSTLKFDINYLPKN